MVGLRVFSTGGGRPLDVAGIERDLAVLWKEASTAGTEPAMRACSANLVIVPPPAEGGPASPRARAQIEELIPAVARTHPSRVIVVERDGPAVEGGGSAAGALSASVSALCFTAGGGRYICCERITLESGSGSEEALPGAILSLLTAEMPVVLWAPGDPPVAQPWFRRLLSFAERLLVDSSTFTAPSAVLEEVRRVVAAGPAAGSKIADFEWLRLLPWRKRLVAAFDPPRAREAAALGFDRVTLFEIPTPASAAPEIVAAPVANSEGDARATAPSSPRQDVLADERPRIRPGSASRLLLESWIGRCVRVGAFAHEVAREAVAPPPCPVADTPIVLADVRRGITALHFEGRTATGPFALDVAAPRLSRPPLLTDFARLLGGHADHPLAPRTRTGARP